MNNKVALITGASSGIGLSTARLFAKENYDVILLYQKNIPFFIISFVK